MRFTVLAMFVCHLLHCFSDHIYTWSFAFISLCWSCLESLCPLFCWLYMIIPMIFCCTVSSLLTIYLIISQGHLFHCFANYIWSSSWYLLHCFTPFGYITKYLSRLFILLFRHPFWSYIYVIILMLFASLFTTPFDYVYAISPHAICSIGWSHLRISDVHSLIDHIHMWSSVLLCWSYVGPLILAVLFRLWVYIIPLLAPHYLSFASGV